MMRKFLAVCAVWLLAAVVPAYGQGMFFLPATSLSGAPAPLSFVNATPATNFNNVLNGSGLGVTAGTSTSNQPDLWASDFTDAAHGITATYGAQTTSGSTLGFTLQVNGTYSGGGQGRIQVNPAFFVEGASQARNFHVSLQVVAGSMTGCTVKVGANASDSTNTYLSTPLLASVTPTGTLARYGGTYTTPASTVYMTDILQVGYTNGTPCNVTLFIGLADDERGSTDHSIQTPGAALVANDSFFSQAIPSSYFVGITESPNASGEPYPFTNGPSFSYSAGRSFNNETRWNNTTNASSGVYNFASVNSWYSTLTAAGVTPLFPMFTGDAIPSWVTGTAQNPNTTSLDAWTTAFVAQMAGKVRIYISMNEVDSSTFWTGTQAQVVAYQQYLYNAVKAVDPTAIVLCPTTTGSMTGNGYYKALLALGIDSYCDAHAMHNYNQTAHYIPEVNVTNAASFLWLVNKFGAANKPVLDTEYSYAANSNVPTNLGKMNFVAKGYALDRSGGTQMAAWYAADNTTFGTWWDPTNGYEDPATAFKIIKTWMQGATLTGPATASGTVWSASLTRPGYTATITWDYAGASNYTVPGSGVTQMRDLYGNMCTLAPGQVVPLTSSPVIFESGNALGQFITGYVITGGTAHNKIVWDTARDGSLPTGSFTATAMTYGTPCGGQFYVSALGSDSNNGTTTATPFLTTAKAQSVQSPGVTISFRGGDTFTEPNFNPGQGGTSGHPITINSYGTGQAIFSSVSGLTNVTDASYITFNNVNMATGFGFDTAASALTSSNIVITNCTIGGIAYFGGDTGTSGTTLVTFTGNTITSGGLQTYGSAAANAAGTRVHSHWTISGNTINGGGTHPGIQLGSMDTATVTSMVSNAQDYYGIWTYASQNVSITGSTVTGTIPASGQTADGNGIGADEDSQNITISGNFTYNNTGAGYLTSAFHATGNANNGSISNVKIFDNLSVNDNSGSVMIASVQFVTNGSPATITGLAAYNNTIYQNRAGKYAVAVTTTGITGYVLNNVFNSGTTGAGFLTTNGALNPSTVQFFNNNYYGTNTLIPWNGTNYANVAAWQAAFPAQETISGTSVAITANPLLTNPGTTTPSDYKPTNGSPLANGLNFASFGLTNPATDYFGATFTQPNVGFAVVPSTGGSGTLGPGPLPMLGL